MDSLSIIAIPTRADVTPFPLYEAGEVTFTVACFHSPFVAGKVTNVPVFPKLLEFTLVVPELTFPSAVLTPNAIVALTSETVL